MSSTIGDSQILAPASIESACAPSPFNHEKADIILRTSDNVDFRVFKLFLSLASPFFETLFDVPQPDEPEEDRAIKDGLAVVPMAENSKTLDALLRFCYPCTLADDPNLEVLEDVLDVLGVAEKYLLDMVETKVRRALCNPKILEAEPLRCFAITRRAQLPEETLLAAKHTLTQPLIPSTFQEIDLITASDLLALLTYHQDCGEAVYALKANLSWIKLHYQTSRGCAWLSGKYPNGTNFHGSLNYCDCQCARSPVPKYILFESQSLQWWVDFMEEVFAALRDKPCRATVENLEAETVQKVRALNCPTCSTSIEEGMRSFSKLLVNKVDYAVSQVKLDFTVPRNRKVGSYSYPAKGGKKKKK